MNTGKFTREQIAFALKQAELGTPVGEIVRKMGVAEATFYKWKKKYGGLGPSELQRLRQLKEEHAKLKRLVVNLSLDKIMLQDVLSKKAVKPANLRMVADELRRDYRVEKRRACCVIRLHHSVYHYKSKLSDQASLW